MDDANALSLLALPHLGFCSHDDARYQHPRAFVLSTDNPHFVRRRAASGIGSPNTGPATIWSMALSMQELTSTDEGEMIVTLACQCPHQLG